MQITEINKSIRRARHCVLLLEKNPGRSLSLVLSEGKKEISRIANAGLLSIAADLSAQLAEAA